MAAISSWIHERWKENRRKGDKSADSTAVQYTVKRILKQQATGTRLEIKFSIAVDTPAALQATQSAMLDQSGSGSGPSTLAQTLISTGALPATAVIQVQSGKTAVDLPPPTAVPTPAPSTTVTSTSAPTTAPTDASSSNTGAIAGAVGGAISGLIVIGLIWRWISPKKQRANVVPETGNVGR
ncbi:hypothetical protein AC1031_015274 [Aphanomyces cochlioides]|nr:hypothetical protein AC1031_015274 [Aphanomyces cochlioides]